MGDWRDHIFFLIIMAISPFNSFFVFFYVAPDLNSTVRKILCLVFCVVFMFIYIFSLAGTYFLFRIFMNWLSWTRQTIPSYSGRAISEYEIGALSLPALIVSQIASYCLLYLILPEFNHTLRAVLFFVVTCLFAVLFLFVAAFVCNRFFNMKASEDG